MTCYDIATKWDRHTIPLGTLKTILKKSKAKKDIEGWEEWGKVWNQSIDDIFTSAQKVAASMNSDSIPVQELKDGLDIYYNTFHDVIMKGK